MSFVRLSLYYIMQRRHWVRLSRHLWPFFLVFLISLSFLLSFHGDTDPQKYSIHETSQNKLEYRALDEESRNMDLIISGDSLTTRESLPGEKIPDIDIKHESGDNDLDSSKSSNFKENECLSLKKKIIIILSTELKVLKWWISRSILDPLFLLISRLI